MSLIEVTIAGSLLAVGAAALLSAWSTIGGILEHQRRLGEATNIVRTQLDAVLGLPAGDAALTAGAHNVGFRDVFGGVGPSANNVFYAVDYDVAADTPGPGFVSVTVRARWSERGVPRSTSLLSFRER